MKQMIRFFTVILVCIGYQVNAQEMVAPINYNPALKGRKANVSFYKTTALALPIFEDFTGYSAYPDSNIWADYQVYVNNTMCISPVSRGVATFDALNQIGKPYDTISSSALRYADSLTVKPIDLSIYQPSDNLFLSFFYQPQGRGFAPETQDSLLLYFKKSNGSWVKIWSKDGTQTQAFKQVIVQVNDTAYFHPAFQFRFVNKASINTNDDVWNLDYIRFDINRNPGDTLVNDVAFSSDPTFMLNDYTYMPYRHFLANANGERATTFFDSIKNNYNSTQSVNWGFTAREVMSNTPLSSNGTTNISINQYSTQGISTPVYTNTVPLGSNVQDKVIFENKFYIESISTADNKVNDTIVKQQIFDNYLAYDDGTAEKSYYLNVFPSLPGKIAIEHHLNEPDILQGVAIYFGRQVPMGSNKIFSIAVYKKLQGIDGAQNDELVYQQDFLFPQYLEVNNFYTYKIDNPVSLPAGTFYIGTIQPALSGSDSLYFGLDVNREMGNHAYYNVMDEWVSSSISGAIMIRPLVGQTVFNTDVHSFTERDDKIGISPNPATNHIAINHDSQDGIAYDIIDMQGRTVIYGNARSAERINISDIAPGIYFIRLLQAGSSPVIKKIIKQ